MAMRQRANSVKGDLVRRLLLIGVLSAAGCDGGAALEPDPSAGLPASPDFAVLECAADVVASRLGCRPPTPRLLAEGGNALIIGGQGVHILLESRDVCFEDGCDPAAEAGIFQAEVSVRNLMPVALGTADGSTVHPAGVRAFFHELPVVTATADGGAGTVTVVGADGVATFTASDQPYSQYDEVLRPGEASRTKRWRWRLSPNVTAFEFSVLVAAETAEPAPEPFVVFDMVVDGNRDIYRVRLDGTDLERLTKSPADERAPTVAGETVVFTRYGDGNGELYALSLTDPEVGPVRLTHTAANETEAALSPDGNRLAYVSDVSGLPRLWVAAADGTGAMPVTAGFGHGGSIEGSPSWAPDGERLVFISTTAGTADLYILHVETGAITPLITSAHPEVEPTWSPDGAHIVFVSNLDAVPSSR